MNLSLSKNIIKFTASNLLYYTGVNFLFSRFISMLKLGQIRILAYHNISDTYPKYLNLSVGTEIFEKQLKYLIGKYDIISYEKALEIIESGKKLNRHKFVLTFDDNYVEYYNVVMPLLKKYRTTGTVYITVDPVITRMPLMADIIVFAISEAKKRHIDFNDIGLGEFQLNNRIEKEFAVLQINSKLMVHDYETRLRYAEIICNRLDFDPKDIEDRFLDWDHIREMKDNGFSIGCHTMSHPVLQEVEKNKLQWEIRESKNILEKELNSNVTGIAYPYGTEDCYNKDTMREVAMSGYNYACTLVHHTTNQQVYEMPRKNMDLNNYSLFNNKLCKPLLSMELSGLGDLLFRKNNILRKNGNGRQDRVHVSRNTKKIRCLYIIDILLGFAGTENHLLRMLKNLDRNKFESMIIVFYAKEKVLDIFRKSGINVVNLNLHKIYSLDALIKFREVIKHIKKYNPDLIQTYHFMSDTYGVMASRIASKAPIISSRRDMGDLKKQRQLALNRLINPLISSYISVCDKVKYQMNKIENIPLDKIETIYNGIHIEDYNSFDIDQKEEKKKLGINPNAFVIGIACMLRQEKDVKTFLKAVKKLVDEQYSFIALIIGDGPEKNNLKDYSKKIGVEQYCIFTGYVDDIRDYMKAIDVVCLTPNQNEGLSNVIIEEMAMKKVIIATDVGGNKELIDDGKTGFIINPGDYQSLTDKILYFYNDRKAIDKMGTEARKKVETHFTIQKMVERHTALYKDIIKK